MELERVEALLKLMVEYGVAELSYEGEGGAVSLRMQSATPAAVAAPLVAASPAPVAPAPAAPAVVSGLVQHSPMVGTFYRAPKPGAPLYVEKGARVRKGQVLCIVEAMKLMNEIECEFDGTLADVLVEDGHPVQFNQPLFRIVPG